MNSILGTLRTIHSDYDKAFFNKVEKHEMEIKNLKLLILNMYLFSYPNMYKVMNT